MKVLSSLIVSLFVLLNGIQAEDTCDITNLAVETIATPADAALYNSSKRQWASQVSSTEISDLLIAPEAIVYCTSDDDVVNTVNFASACNYTIVIRSGGHQYSGWSSCKAGNDRCIQLDVSMIKTYDYDNTTNTLVLGPGVQLGDAVQLFAADGIVVPGGVCPTVSIGGHMQTSAVGVFGRSFGSGMDLIKSFRMVMANGTIENVTSETHEELFKSTLGAAPGSFGVVLDYTFEPVRSVDYPGSAGFNFGWPYTHDILVAVGGWVNELGMMEEIAQDLSIGLFVTPFSGAPTAGDFTHFIFVAMVWSGRDNGPLFDEEGNPNELYEKYIQPFKNITIPGLPFPQADLDAPLPLDLLNLGFVIEFDHDPFRYHIASVTTADMELNNEYWEMLASEIDERLIVPNMFTSYQMQLYGGPGEGSRLNRNKDLNYFLKRHMKYHIDDWVFFTDEIEPTARSHSISLYEKSIAIVNETEPEITWFTTRTTEALDLSLPKDWERFYPDRETFDALVDLKTEVDPTDVFKTDTTVPIRADFPEADDSVVTYSPDQCFAFLALNFDVAFYDLYDTYFLENSTATLSEAGTFTGPSHIQEYMTFADTISPYIDNFTNVAEANTFEVTGFDPITGVCKFLTFSITDYVTNTTTTKGENFRTAIAVTIDYSIPLNKVPSLAVYYTREYLNFVFTDLLASNNTYSHVCSVMENDCSAVWEANGLSSQEECVSKMEELSVLTNDYFDGNDRGCRSLHGAFVPLNPEDHCAHLSFMPMEDPAGDILCQNSLAIDPLDLFTQQELDLFYQYLEVNGIPEGYALLADAPSGAPVMAPVEMTSAPTPAPVTSTPAPVASTPAPVGTTPDATPAPVASTPAPVETTAAPINAPTSGAKVKVCMMALVAPLLFVLALN